MPRQKREQPSQLPKNRLKHCALDLENLLLENSELYDLANDSGESYDVSSRHPEVVAHLRQRLDAIIPTFPTKVVETYNQLKTTPDSPTTPPGAAARPAGYKAPPFHYD